MDEITVQHLETQIQRAASCASATLPARELVPLLKAALHACNENTLSDDIQTLMGTIERAGSVDVTIDGDEIRLILDLALQDKIAELEQKPRLRVVN
jgi:hypothetical protein